MKQSGGSVFIVSTHGERRRNTCCYNTNWCRLMDRAVNNRGSVLAPFSASTKAADFSLPPCSVYSAPANNGGKEERPRFPATMRRQGRATTKQIGDSEFFDRPPRLRARSFWLRTASKLCGSIERRNARRRGASRQRYLEGVSRDSVLWGFERSLVRC